MVSDLQIAVYDPDVERALWEMILEAFSSSF